MLELDAYTARADQAEKQIEILIKVRLRIMVTKTLMVLFALFEYCIVKVSKGIKIMMRSFEL